MSARWPKLSKDGVPAEGVVLLDFYQASCAPCRIQDAVSDANDVLQF